MRRKNPVLGLLPIMLVVLFVSISTYRIFGSNTYAVLFGGAVLSTGTLIMSIKSISLLMDEKLRLTRTPVMVGAAIVSVVAFSLYFVFQINIFNSAWILLAILLLVMSISFWAGSRATRNLLEGFYEGFVIGSVSGIPCSVLFSHEAITRDVTFNVLVAIFSITAPLVIGSIGTVFGLLGKLAVDHYSKHQ